MTGPTDFFSQVVDRFRPRREPRIAVLTHLLPDRPAFLRALNGLGRIEWLIPVGYSESRGVAEQVAQLRIPIRRAPTNGPWPPETRWFRDELDKTLRSCPGPLVLCEIGGYFAPTVEECIMRRPGRLLGVVEDTEAGHLLYTDEALSIPVVSVARSPLKAPEDLLVGESVAFSAERILRWLGRPLRGTAATVLGYGRVGSATALALSTRGARVAVWDPDPSRRILAVAAGFATPARKIALQYGDLIIGASGRKSLEPKDLADVHDGCVLASASSRQIEFDLGNTQRRLITNGESDAVIEAITLANNKDAYVASQGFPINLPGAALVGPFPQLVQAEIIAAISRLVDDEMGTGIQEVSQADRQELAQLWINCYLDSVPGRNGIEL